MLLVVLLVVLLDGVGSGVGSGVDGGQGGEPRCMQARGLRRDPHTKRDLLSATNNKIASGFRLPSRPCSGSARSNNNPHPHIQNFLPSMELKEQNWSCQRKQARTSYEGSAYLFGVIRLDRRVGPHREQPPFFN